MAWNQPNQNLEATRNRKREYPSLTFGTCLVVFVLIVAAILLFVVNDTADDALPKGKAEKPVVPKKVVKPTPLKQHEPTEKKLTTAKPKANTKEVVSTVAKTNKTGVVVETLTLADGSVIEKVRPPKAIFSNPSDQLISLALSVKPGQSMPPLPGMRGLEKDFLDSLLEPIVIEDDDSDQVKEMKLAVKEARAYIAAEIKNGKTVQGCLSEYREHMEATADSHLMAIQEIQKMKESGADDESISEFRSRINELLRDKGYAELPVP